MIFALWNPCLSQYEYENLTNMETIRIEGLEMLRFGRNFITIIRDILEPKREVFCNNKTGSLK